MSHAHRIDAFLSSKQELLQGEKEICLKMLAQELARELDKAEALVYVPGLWKCAKCKCTTISTTINAHTGLFKANVDPQQCPNDCGPMWRVTERDAGNDLVDRMEPIQEELTTARRELEEERSLLAHFRRIVDDGPSCGRPFADVTHSELSSKIRMLTRSDLNFEPIVQAARDRILWLADKLHGAISALSDIVMQPMSCTTDYANNRHEKQTWYAIEAKYIVHGRAVLDGCIPEQSRPRKCPTCGSPGPHLHPAVQHEGEVQTCADPWHQPTEDGLLQWREPVTYEKSECAIAVPAAEDGGVAQDDLAEILRTVGLGDHARPHSPHEVVQRELLPRLRQLNLSTPKAGMEAAAKICDQGAQLMNSPMYITACEEMAKGIREAAAKIPDDGRDELLDGMKRRIGSGLAMGADASAGENQQYLLNVLRGMQRFVIEWERRHKAGQP